MCPDCKQELDESAFYKTSSSCKKCRCAQVRAYQLKNIDAVREYDRQRAKTPKRRAHSKQELKKWREENPEKAKASRMRYIEKYKARTAVGNALRDGLLAKDLCEVCGAINVEGHHDDYSKPLEVRWLCGKHHKEYHAEEDKNMQNYRIVIEPYKDGKGEEFTNFKATVPDLPGIEAFGATEKHARAKIFSMIRIHIDKLKGLAKSPSP